MSDGMAVLKIAKHPDDDDVLRRPAAPVDKITDKTRRLIADMIETMDDAVGVGLAAPQVFISQRLFVYDTGDGPKALINPEVLESEGEELGTEGCLSIPRLQGDVARSTRLVVSGLNQNGRRVRFELKDFPARVFQHEIDHLNGVLFTDRALKETLHWLTDEEEAERKSGGKRRGGGIAPAE
jgi:peptide deformylase